MSGDRGKKIRLEEGISQDRYGFVARVTVRPVTREQRFKPDVPRDHIRLWRAQTRAVLLVELAARGGPPPTDTLTRDVDRYLKTRDGRPGYQADRSHLKAWTALYGDERRGTLGQTHAQIAIDQWQRADVAPQTIKHRIRALRQLYVALDGKRAPHPCQDIERPRIPHPDPRPTSVDVMTTVAENLADGDPKTRARFLVLAYTAARPVELMRARPEDVHLKQHRWYVETAKGGAPRTIPLGPEATRAWEAFIEADAWGPYDTSRHAKRLHRAGWPKGERPYNLRHTVAMDMLERGRDLIDVQGILGHKSMETTARYYARPSLLRLRRAMLTQKLGLI